MWRVDEPDLEGAYMYSISHWGMFEVFYAGWLPLTSGGNYEEVDTAGAA
jgi:hypothetical protein